MKKCTTNPCPYKEPYCPKCGFYQEIPTCPNGHNSHIKKSGFGNRGIQRYKCMECGKKFQMIYLDNSGSNNGMWKGDEVQRIALHEWIRNRKPKPDLCEECHELPPYDLANISGEYLRDINDFRWLCRRCHVKSDGRMKNLKQFQLSNQEVTWES